jgi:hypothetical protein
VSDRADPPKPRDLHAEWWRRLEDAILRSSGTLETSVREALAAGGEVPEPLAAYAEKVAHHAYRVTDDDIHALLAAGYSQDQIFEATLSVALGAAQARLRAGLAARHAASQGSETAETQVARKGPVDAG